MSYGKKKLTSQRVGTRHDRKAPSESARSKNNGEAQCGFKKQIQNVLGKLFVIIAESPKQTEFDFCSKRTFVALDEYLQKAAASHQTLRAGGKGAQQ